MLINGIMYDGGPAAIVPYLIGGPITTAAIVAGFVMVQPKQSKVLVLFGAYNGTLSETGLRWVNPFNYPRIPVSLRLRNFESGKNKVNDANGNPIEIAAIVVWRVTDTAEATFEVDNYKDFVAVQSEAAVRTLASRYAYDLKDSKDSAAVSLRANPTEVADMLQHEIQDRLNKAGVEVVEARISHLAYAQEIALPCCNANKPPPLWTRVRQSLKARWAWSKWHSINSLSVKSWSLTTSAEQRWFQTCWSFCVGNRMRNRW